MDTEWIMDPQWIWIPSGSLANPLESIHDPLEAIYFSYFYDQKITLENDPLETIHNPLEAINNVHCNREHQATMGQGPVFVVLLVLVDKG